MPQNPGLTASLTALKACAFEKKTSRRIRRLLTLAPRAAPFLAGTEAQDLAERIRVSLDLDGRLSARLRQAEQAGHLPTGTAETVLLAKQAANPYLAALHRLAWDHDLAVLDPEIRTQFPRKPGALAWALTADLLAEEIRSVSPRRVWPIVSTLLTPLLTASGSQLQPDAAHLRKFVVRWKNQIGASAWREELRAWQSRATRP